MPLQTRIADSRECSVRPTRRSIVSLVTVSALGVGFVGLQATSAAGDGEPFARAALHLADGTKVGRVTFTANEYRTVVRMNLNVPAEVTAVRSFHGLHVHANDDATNGTGCQANPSAPPSTWFVSADGHLSEEGQVHSRHTGDMTSVYLNRDGSARMVFTTDRMTPAQVDGRAVIVHADEDNFGNVPVGDGPEDYTPNSPAALEKTAKTGNAGDRIACGVVSLR